MIVSAKGRVGRWVWCDSVFLSMAVILSAFPSPHSLVVSVLQGFKLGCQVSDFDVDVAKGQGKRAQPRSRSTDVLPLQEHGAGKPTTSQRRPASGKARSRMAYPIGVHDACSGACIGGVSVVGKKCNPSSTTTCGEVNMPLHLNGEHQVVTLERSILMLNIIIYVILRTHKNCLPP